MLHSNTVNLACLCFYLIALFISVHKNEAKETFLGLGPQICVHGFEEKDLKRMQQT